MGQSQSTVDEGGGHVVMLYYRLPGLMIQIKGSRGERGGIRIHVGQPYSTVDEGKDDV